MDMFCDNKIWIGQAEDKNVCILPKMANRHGLIAGATGTGKTITLKVLAESFSDAGVPVFLADIKGDLSGMVRPGVDSEDMQARIQKFGLNQVGFSYKAYPAAFWDIYGQSGINLRTTISEMGPVLLSKIMNLNDTQSDILTCLFKMADDEDLLLVDIKDLKAMLQYASENADELSLKYGRISKQSVAAIIRGVVALEAAGGEDYFTEPGINIVDFFKTSIEGKGVINILDGRKLVNDPTLYSAFLLYLLSELFETLPEVGDLERPRMVFFFDEAHLLFNNASKELVNKIEQIVKLIRSKGVGVYFITQSPRDIPDGVLAQLGNKIQHALRAYTPSEEKAIKAAAESFRVNPAFDTKTVLSELGVGEALVSVLDEDGIPTIVERCKILPPASLMGAISDDEKQKEIVANNLYLAYKDAKDPDSAYEYLERLKAQRELAETERQKALKEEKEAKAQRIAQEKEAAKEEARKEKEAEREKARLEKEAAKEAAAKEREEARLAAAREKEAAREAAAKEKAEKAQKDKYKRVAGQVAGSAAGTIGREIGKELGGSVGGTFGKRVGGNVMSQLGRSLMGTLFK